MPEIKSPLGTTQFPSQKNRILSVSDESNPEQWELPPNAQSYFVPEASFHTHPTNIKKTSTPLPEGAIPLTAEQFKDLQAQRQALRQQTSQLSSEAQQRIEMLTGIGRKETTVEEGGHFFTFQTLKGKETREAVKLSAQVSGTDSMFELRAQTLARALIKIDGHPVNLVLGTDDVEVKAYLIEEFGDHVINKFYTAYSEMFKNKTPESKEEAEKIAADIKK